MAGYGNKYGTSDERKKFSGSSQSKRPMPDKKVGSEASFGKPTNKTASFGGKKGSGATGSWGGPKAKTGGYAMGLLSASQAGESSKPKAAAYPSKGTAAGGGRTNYPRKGTGAGGGKGGMGDWKTTVKADVAKPAKSSYKAKGVPEYKPDVGAFYLNATSGMFSKDAGGKKKR